MSTVRPFKTFSGFSKGLNNVKDPLTLSTDELSKAKDIDIDDQGWPSRRRGRTPLLAGRYKWLSDVDENVCLGVIDNTLVSLLPDLSGHTVLRSGVSNDARMTYVKILNRIYYSNQEIIGYVENGTSYSLSVPTKNFKDVMPPAKFLVYFRARMWAVVGNQLIPSDVGDYGVRDLRVAPKQFPAPITLAFPVRDGMFIGAGAIYFMAVDDPLEMKADALRKLADYDAIPYMATRVEGGTVVDGKTIKGTVLFFATEQGACMGADGGEFINLTMQAYNMATGYEGAALFRTNHKGTTQVIMTVVK